MALSIYNEPTAAPQSMPLKLKLVIAGLALSILQEVWWIQAIGSDTRTLVRIGVAVAAIVFLIRGSDLARALTRVVAGLGAGLAVWVLIQFHSLGIGFGSWIVLSSVGVALIAAFIVWALGQDDVQAWMRARSSPGAMPPAIGSFGGGRTR